MKKKLTVAALALGLIVGPTAPALAHHDYKPPNYWLCTPFPFLCGGR